MSDFEKVSVRGARNPGLYDVQAIIATNVTSSSDPVPPP